MSSLKLLHLLAWMVMVFGGLFSVTSNADWSPEELELIKLSDAWIVAEVTHDREALERILDERFLSTFSSSGKTIDRSEYIRWIMKSEINPFEVLNEVVNIHGKTALVISISTDRTTKFTWIAVKKAEQWKVISQTFSMITAIK